VQVSLHVISIEKDSPKVSIEDIATLIYPSNSLITSSIRIIDMDQQVTTRGKNKGKAPMNELPLKEDQDKSLS
jgi:hypothetical protein